jgi:molybdate transport system regulatory protein
MTLTTFDAFIIVSLYSVEDNGVRIAYKVWLDHDGKAFGDGPYELLSRIEHTHSLHQASQQMGMSYSKALRLIRTMEKRLGFTLLHTKVGGESGGGSMITSPARKLMRHYGLLQKDVTKALEKIYQKHFESLSPLPPSIGGERRNEGKKGNRK